jgi:hypothetical protein
MIEVREIRRENPRRKNLDLLNSKGFIDYTLKFFWTKNNIKVVLLVLINLWDRL